MSFTSTGASEWRAGTATAVITPEDEPHHLRGFAARDGPMDGVEDDLHAKVLALEDRDGKRLLFITYEALAVPPELRSWLETECANRWDLPADAIVTNPSHTHYAPDVKYTFDDVDDDSPERVELAAAFRDSLEETLLELVDEALSSLTPVEVSYSHARCGMAMSRRDLTAEQVHFGPYPDGPVDHDVPVLVLEADGTVQGILFGYACHTTSLAHYNRVSGDYAGYAMAYLEAEYPEATALFVIGCGGDQKAYPQGDLELTRHYGKALGTSVRAAVDARSRSPVHGPLNTRRERIHLTREPEDDADADGHADDATASEQAYPIQAIGFGSDLTMLSLAGEVTAEYACTLKDRLSAPLWVAAYSQSAGYIPTARILAEGGYEARTSGGPGRYVPETESRILEKATALAERVGGSRTGAGH